MDSRFSFSIGFSHLLIPDYDDHDDEEIGIDYTWTLYRQFKQFKS